MSLPTYQVKILDSAYALTKWIKDWKRLKYRQALNNVCSATLTLHPDSNAIASIDTNTFLQIIRNGSHVFGGPVLRPEWELPQTAPQGEVFTCYALDHAIYADWRIVIPPPATAYATYTDHAGDAMKDFVYNNLGLGAAAARRFADLTIEADGHQGTSTTYTGRYEKVLTKLQTIAAGASLDFRFVPTAAGCTFTVASAWGLDRTQGNGVNNEAVFALDRRNFLSARYVKDALAHVNYVYVGGQGEGAARTITERSTPGDITLYGRREAFADARDTAVAAELQARGDAALLEAEVVVSGTVQPIASTWKATAGTTWDLGDLMTIFVKRWGRSFAYDGKAVAIDVEVNEDGTETVTPVLEAA